MKVSADKSRPWLLIADDHTIFAEALRAYLEKTYRVVGVVTDGRAMIDEAINLRPDVVIVDVGMPRLNGSDAVRRIKEQAPKVKFVFLTMQDDPNLRDAALALGPVAFVPKPSDGPDLLKAIGQVLQGKSNLSEVAGGRLDQQKSESHAVFRENNFASERCGPVVRGRPVRKGDRDAAGIGREVSGVSKGSHHGIV